MDSITSQVASLHTHFKQIIAIKTQYKFNRGKNQIQFNRSSSSIILCVKMTNGYIMSIFIYYVEWVSSLTACFRLDTRKFKLQAPKTNSSLLKDRLEVHLYWLYSTLVIQNNIMRSDSGLNIHLPKTIHKFEGLSTLKCERLAFILWLKYKDMYIWKGKSKNL